MSRAGRYFCAFLMVVTSPIWLVAFVITAAVAIAAEWMEDE